MFFFTGVTLSLVGLAVSGSLHRGSGELALLCGPGVVAGFWAGRRTYQRADR